MSRSVILAGIGAFAPPRVVSNADFAQMVDTSDEWIVSRTGMKLRRLSEPGTGASDLAFPAAQKALERAGIAAADLDLIIVGTVTPDQPLPAAACFLQQKLGAHRAAAFDVVAACSGWIFGITIARSMLLTGPFRHALVVGVEVMSTILDYTDRSTCVLFGDGAAATVLSLSDAPGRGILATEIRTDGNAWDAIQIPAGGSLHPVDADALAARSHKVKMLGKEVFKTAVRHMSESCRNVMGQAGVTMADLDLVIPHQANRRILDAIAERLEVPPSKLFVNIETYGNTSSASVGLALNEAVETGRVKEGSLVLTTALGAGLAWGAALIRL